MYSNIVYSYNEIKIQLPWYPSIEYVHFYVCDNYKIFEKNGIKINLKYYTPGIDVVKEVLSNNADIGLQDSIPIIQSISNGDKIISFFNFYQETPLALVSLKEKNVRVISDLIGKTLVTHKGYEFYFDYLIKKYPYLSDKVKFKYISNPNILIKDAIQSGLGDVGTVFEMVQAPLFRIDNNDINVIRYHDLGFDIVSHLLFSRRDYAKTNRDLIKKLLKSIITCHKIITSNPNNVVNILSKKYIPLSLFKEHKFNNIYNYKEYLLSSLKIFIHYTQLNDRYFLGIINTNQIKTLASDINKYGLIKNDLSSLDEMIDNSIIRELYESKI